MLFYTNDFRFFRIYRLLRRCKKKKIVASDYFQYIATLILNANIPQLLLIHIIKITGKEQFIYLTSLQISLH